MRDPHLARKSAGIWHVNVRTLAAHRGFDLVELLILLRSPTTSLVKATELARTSGLPRRTIAHWCLTRPGFAVRVGNVYYVALDRLGVTPEEVASRRREQDSAEE